MHPQTLRIYERKGLIEPYRTPGGTRRYSQADIDRLSLIQDLTEQGLNLEGVKRVMALQAKVERLEGKVEALRDELERTRAEARRAVEQAHQSHRHEIVLRSEALPEVRRRPRR
jgi:MerR family transcriptional regulator/heat shock protein HspR